MTGWREGLGPWTPVRRRRPALREGRRRRRLRRVRVAHRHRGVPARRRAAHAASSCSLRRARRAEAPTSPPTSIISPPASVRRVWWCVSIPAAAMSLTTSRSSPRSRLTNEDLPILGTVRRPRRGAPPRLQGRFRQPLDHGVEQVAGILAVLAPTRETGRRPRWKRMPGATSISLSSATKRSLAQDAAARQPARHASSKSRRIACGRSRWPRGRRRGRGIQRGRRLRGDGRRGGLPPSPRFPGMGVRDRGVQAVPRDRALGDPRRAIRVVSAVARPEL